MNAVLRCPQSFIGLRWVRNKDRVMWQSLAAQADLGPGNRKKKKKQAMFQTPLITKKYQWPTTSFCFINKISVFVATLCSCWFGRETQKYFSKIETDISCDNMREIQEQMRQKVAQLKKKPRRKSRLLTGRHIPLLVGKTGSHAPQLRKNRRWMLKHHLPFLNYLSVSHKGMPTKRVETQHWAAGKWTTEICIYHQHHLKFTISGRGVKSWRAYGHLRQNKVILLKY